MGPRGREGRAFKGLGILSSFACWPFNVKKKLVIILCKFCWKKSIVSIFVLLNCSVFTRNYITSLTFVYILSHTCPRHCTKKPGGGSDLDNGVQTFRESEFSDFHDVWFFATAVAIRIDRLFLKSTFLNSPFFLYPLASYAFIFYSLSPANKYY